MPTSIDIREIPLFQFFELPARQALSKTFTRMIFEQGQDIVTYGHPVLGIYFIVDGNVRISVPEIPGSLGVYERGQCIGEMSLIEEAPFASASATVISATSKILFCSVADFKAHFAEFPESSVAFYRSSAILLSKRLRHTTERLNKELHLGQTLLQALMRESATGSEIAQAKSNVERTGHTVVSKLMELSPLIDTIEAKHPEAYEDIEHLRKKIEEVFLIDTQEFDRISQQLNQIEQHFENLRRVASGGEAMPLTGDRNLFSP